ncbi:AbrB family transcriptional regulator [Neotabrizicola sp. sgz301269]|uniref:AbrB family transcriptional regulator n=1 Tax=Neotabrizicola sp. sgz301269 TaxID=3276282 RepID=UPI0037706FE0
MSPFLRIVFGLIIGVAGGALFHWLALPLPWMLGALFATMAAAVGGLPVKGPKRLRPATVAVIGVLLGSRFTPDVLVGAGQWGMTLAIMLVYLAVVGMIVVPFYRHLGRFDWTTAYFAGMPGGLNEMVEIGEARGARVEQVILAQSLRIVTVIAMIAVWFRMVQGAQISGAARAGAEWPDYADLALMLAAAVFGSLMGRKLRFPAPTFLGPLILSGALHLGGVTESAPPGLVVNTAQVILGTVLGCRFAGIGAAALGRAGVLSMGATILALALALAGGLAMQAATGVGMEQALLALAPGGLTEMGLVALAIQADAAFVVLHHVIRILAVIVAAPLLHRLLSRDDPPAA